jgi:aromatic ring-cleaving dioxygenase
MKARFINQWKLEPVVGGPKIVSMIAVDFCQEEYAQHVAWDMFLTLFGFAINVSWFRKHR